MVGFIDELLATGIPHALPFPSPFNHHRCGTIRSLPLTRGLCPQRGQKIFKVAHLLNIVLQPGTGV